MDKTYCAGLQLGVQSETDDVDGQVTDCPCEAVPTKAALMQVLAGFVGTISQVPPAHSAARVAGRRAYKLARAGIPVPLKARPVTVHRIDVVGYQWPRLDLEVRCG